MVDPMLAACGIVSIINLVNTVNVRHKHAKSHERLTSIATSDLRATRHSHFSIKYIANTSRIYQIGHASADETLRDLPLPGGS
jgi:hypothetical protein